MKRIRDAAWWTERMEDERYLSEHAVYFVQYGAGGLIKIGVTRDIDARMKSLQPYCPLPVRLIGWQLGGFHEENRLHKLFDESRAWGEWFRPTEDILCYVAENTQIAGRPPAPEMPAHRMRGRYQPKSTALVPIKSS